MSDQQMRLYKQKDSKIVTAVQLDLDTTGFSFEKWGHTQRCQPGDWIVNSDDDCYTIADSIFRETYKKVSPGRFLKHSHIYAIKVETSGQVSTHEGVTNYKAGDYLIENSADPKDTYAIDAKKFHQLYEPVST